MENTVLEIILTIIPLITTAITIFLWYVKGYDEKLKIKGYLYQPPKGLNTLEVAESLGVGTRESNLINVDPDEPDEDNGNLKLFLLILIPGVVILLVVAGLIIFFICRKNKENQINNGSLGVSMTSKNENENKHEQ